MSFSCEIDVTYGESTTTERLVGVRQHRTHHLSRRWAARQYELAAHSARQHLRVERQREDLTREYARRRSGRIGRG